MAFVTYDCPHAEVCKTCPCAAEDDVCFPGERLRAEVERLREALRKIGLEAADLLMDSSARRIARLAREALEASSGSRDRT